MYGVFQPQGFGGMMAGGYPNGYPPNMSQNMNPCQLNPGTPIEVTSMNGSVTTIPAAPMQQPYIPGGMTVNPGGFNPATGMNTPTMGAQGFNPYVSYQNMVNSGVQMPNVDFNRFPPGFGGNMMGQGPGMMGGFGMYSPLGVGMINPYGQNQFNTALQEFLYNENYESMDVEGLLRNIVLTDEEKEKIDHNKSNYIIGQDYYGRPIYNNGYMSNTRRQEEIQQARDQIKNYFTSLSRIAHAYSGDEFDEEAVKKRFDPLQDVESPQEDRFDYYTATPEERERYNAKAQIAVANDIERNYDRSKQIEESIANQKLAMFNQIKASHDKMLGFEPGEHYSLQEFLDNGYKIRVNIAHKKAKSLTRNGTNKYSRSDFRANLARMSNSPVPITSKDDEYVSIEEMLKGVYDRNKSNMVNSVMGGPNGAMYGKAPMTPAFNSEMEAHQYFMKAIQEKKDSDDVKRSVV